jgi:long-chain acyl-CoA synthetase
VNPAIIRQAFCAGRGNIQRAAEQVEHGLGLPRNLIEALRQSVVARGTETALASKAGRRWVGTSYEELWRRVECFAAGLHSLGVGKGAKVAIISNNRPEWPVADFAIQSLGAATVPVYPTLGADQVAHILADSGVVVAIAEDKVILGSVIGG